MDGRMNGWLAVWLVISLRMTNDRPLPTAIFTEMWGWVLFCSCFVDASCGGVDYQLVGELVVVGWLWCCGECDLKLDFFRSSSLFMVHGSAVIAAQVLVRVAMGAVHTRMIVRGRCLHVTAFATKSVGATAKREEEEREEGVLVKSN